jgi:thioredoxin reductase (NADPH)
MTPKKDMQFTAMALVGKAGIDQHEYVDFLTSTLFAARAAETRNLFLCLGGVPYTEWADDVGIVRDSEGYLMTGPDLLKDGKWPEVWQLDRAPYYLETSVPGVFAAGDVRHGSVKRCASAVGEGAMAVTFVHRYLANG